MKPQPQDQLDWLALQYVAGELESDELADFETRLAEEQPAREAVAVAVELTQAVNLAFEAEPVTLTPTTTGKGLGSWWLGAAMGAAACLLIVLGVQQIQHDVQRAETIDPEVESPAAPVQDDSALAARWSEIHHSDVAAWDETSIDEDDSYSDWTAEEHAHAAPDWMMAAVSAARKAQSMNDDMDMERSVDGPIEQ